MMLLNKGLSLPAGKFETLGSSYIVLCALSVNFGKCAHSMGQVCSYFPKMGGRGHHSILSLHFRSICLPISLHGSS